MRKRLKKKLYKKYQDQIIEEAIKEFGECGHPVGRVYFIADEQRVNNTSTSVYINGKPLARLEGI